MIQNTRLLRGVVIVLGAVVVVGFAVLLATIGLRVAEPPVPRPALDRIALPAGATVMEIDLDGDRLALRLAFPGGEQEVAVYDVVTGARLRALAVPAATP